MNIILHACPVTEVTKHSVCMSPMETIETHTFENIRNRDELNEAFKTFRRVVKEKGRAACITIIRHPRDRSRAFAGFNKLRTTYYVNIELAPGYDAARDAACAEREEF